MMDLDPTLNLAVHPSLAPLTQFNGPGYRFALWTQGCSILCTDVCISPQLLSKRVRHLLTVGEVLEVLKERTRRAPLPVEGITFLGGEPTDQAAALALIGCQVRTWGWSVMTYSGYTLEQLHAKGDSGIEDLLSNTDILVDGPFKKELQDSMLRWRGSSNQRIILLTDRYKEEEIEVLPVLKGVDVTVSPNHELLITGLQDKILVKRLAESFRRRGIIR